MFNIQITSGYTFKDFIYNIISLLDIVIYLIIALAVIVFFYGIVLYIAKSDSESERKKGVQYILFGIIGLFVMISVWGLVYILTSTFGFKFGIIQF